MLANGLHRLVAYVLIPLMVITVAAEVLARYVFRVPLQWSEEVVTCSLLLSFVAAFPICLARNVNVRVETLYERFGVRTRRFADALGHLCGAIFLGMLALGAGRESWGMFKRGDATETAGIPHGPLAAAVGLIAAGCALWMLWQMLRPTREPLSR